MGHSSVGSLKLNANQSSGVGLGAILALAPAAILMSVPPASEWSDYVGPKVQIMYEHGSTWSASEVQQRNTDANLRDAAAAAFQDLLRGQSDIEPDIAAVIYADRSSLYWSS